MTIIRKKQRWWQRLFGPMDPNRASTSWVEQRECKRTLTTPTAEHTCTTVGPHWQHTCVDEDCKFRWAA